MFPKNGCNMKGYRSNLNAADPVENSPFDDPSAKTLHYAPLCGHAELSDKKFTVTPGGLRNYWFIPAKDNTVSYCVVSAAGAGSNFYVMSDQFGGCEVHTLQHSSGTFAFLHVYRGTGGVTVKYDLAANWKRLSIKHSKGLVRKFGPTGSIFSFTCIDRSTSTPSVDTQFIHVKGYPDPVVSDRADGDAPYTG